MTTPSIDVFYIVRGADLEMRDRLLAFCRSYRRFAAGSDHKLHVILKGFANAVELEQARRDLRAELESFEEIFLPDVGFDLGAYRSAAIRTDGDFICCLNGSSVILGEYWLQKLVNNLVREGIGLVGCTGSYEAPQHAGTSCPQFPNPHLRSNAFAIDRRRFLAAMPSRPFASKLDAYAFEHGWQSLTAQIQAEGLGVLIVGRDGRGFEMAWWPRSDTFRQGDQSNLLVGDNQTLLFRRSTVENKRTLFALAWGDGSLFQVPLNGKQATPSPSTLASGQTA